MAFFYLIIEGNQAAFCGVNASRALHRKHHFVSETLWRNGSASGLPDQKVAFSNHVGVRRYLLDIKRVMS